MCPECLKISRLSGKMSEWPKILSKLFRTSGEKNSVHKVLCCQETCQNARKLSRERNNFRECLETFQTIWKLLRMCVNFPDYVENLPDNIKFWMVFRTVSLRPGFFFFSTKLSEWENFSGSSATEIPMYFCLCSQPTDFSKNFRNMTELAYENWI